MKKIKSNINIMVFIALILYSFYTKSIYADKEYILILHNYSFFLISHIVAYALICIPVIKYRREQTKLSEWLGKITELPCIVLSFLLFYLVFPAELNVNENISLTLLFITLIFGIIISHSNFKRQWSTVTVSLVNAVIFIPLCFSLLISYAFANLGEITVMEIAYSPDKAYKAYVIEGNYGATGGEHSVYVRENEEINSLIGKYYKKGDYVWSGSWNSIPTIQWKDNNTLIVNDEEYKME